MSFNLQQIFTSKIFYITKYSKILLFNCLEQPFFVPERKNVTAYKFQQSVQNSECSQISKFAKNALNCSRLNAIKISLQENLITHKLQ